MGGGDPRRFVLRIILVLAVIASGQPAAVGEHSGRQTGTPCARSSVIETANFRIYGISRLANSAKIAGDLESLRSELCRRWLGQRRLADWSPKCDVVVHATAASYGRAVGQDQFATVGSSRIDVVGRTVALRRLDIRADQAGWFVAAVPHELTHIIMADEFHGGELPAWADEGMAVLADTPAKQSLHRRDLELGRQSGSICRLAQFVGRASYPAAAEIPVFYGQSVSLVAFLVARRSPADFVRFLHLSEKAGCDAALAEVYGLPNIAELEHQWLASATTTAERVTTASVSPSATVVRPSPRKS